MDVPVALAGICDMDVLVKLTYISVMDVPVVLAAWQQTWCYVLAAQDNKC